MNFLPLPIPSYCWDTIFPILHKSVSIKVSSLAHSFILFVQPSMNHVTALEFFVVLSHPLHPFPSLSSNTVSACQQSGVVNGSLSAVIAVVYLPTAGRPALPDLVICTFDIHIGPPFIPGTPNSVPIVPMTGTWNQYRQVLSRTQLALSFVREIDN
mgnify:CR=1 FL=1